MSICCRLAAVASLLFLLAAAPVRAALTEGPRLARIYDTILSARFAEADLQLRQACPPAPLEACQALGVVSLWWEILIHPESRLQDERFTRLAAAAIEGSEAWIRREPRRAEAWFYLAGSYAPLVQWRVLRGERLAAARDGRRIKNALDRALELDPTLNDAHFGLGLYRYYADIVPAPAKLVRWLLFLPGGDRVKGLQEMLQARDRGELLGGEADYQLHLIYLWYEHKPAEALELLRTLDTRHGSNPLFLQRIAEVQDTHFHDHPASARTWRTLIDRAQGDDLYGRSMAEVRARLGLAAELAAMEQPQEAIDQLRIVIDTNPLAPVGARARAEQQLRALSRAREK